MKTLLLMFSIAGTTVFAQNAPLTSQPVMNLFAVVTGNPYSAQAVTEAVQTLADGNRITQSTSSPVYRDRQGRQRREVASAIPAPGPAGQIVITDPVAGANWTLNPTMQIAFRGERPAAPPISPLPPTSTSPTGGSIGVRFRLGTVSNGRVVVGDVVPGSPAADAGLQLNDVLLAVNGQAIKDGADMAMRINRLAPGTPVQITFERQGKSSTVTMIVQARATTFGEPGPFARLQSALTPEELSTLSAGRRSPSKVEDLGTMNIEGLLARGTRTTITYPAGEAGNERPFSLVNEVWYSIALQAILVSKHNDPRSGDVTYRLTEIKRSEPPASVFEIPSGYTVRPGPGR